MNCTVKGQYIIVGDNSTITVNNQKSEEISSAPIHNYVVARFTYYARIQLDKKIQAVVKGKVQILHGTIGTGKSSAAVNFIHNARDKFAIIWCIDCAKGGESNPSIQSDLSDLAKKLNVQADELFHAIEKKAEKEDVLFLLDNLEEKQADEFNELWKIKDSVYIIATTNNASLNIPNAEEIPVDTFHEAVQFLKEAKEAREENSEDDVKQLCEYFSWNVLGLTSAKSYIIDEKQSIQSYLEMLRDEEAAPIVRETEQEKGKRILYAAVSACLKNINKDQFRALAVMSIIGHDNIPEFLLSSVFSSKSAPAREANLNRLHTSLRLKSLVHVTNQDQVRFFSFHQFTQSVVYDLLSEDEDLRRELIYKVAGILVKYFNKDNRYGRNASMLRILAHHAEVFLQALKKEKMDDRTSIASARLSELVGFAYTQGAQRQPDWLHSSAQHFMESEDLLHHLCGITDDDLKDLTKSQESKSGKSSPLGITDFHTSIAQHLFKKLSKKSSELSISTVYELAFWRTINSDDLSLFPEHIKNRLKKKENSFEPLSEEDVNLLVGSGVAYCVDDYRKLFLPELYVSLLYSFGRNYFYFSDKQSVQQPSDYVDRLKLSHCIALEIAKEMKPGDAVIHEYLTQSNALLYFLVNREVTCKGGGLKENKEHCQDMKIAIECYRKLMQEERQFFEMGILKKEKNGKFSQMVCLHQIVQCYIKLMSPEMMVTNDERDELIKDGVNECKKLLALAQTEKDVKGKVSKGLQNISKDLNIVGEFCLAINCNDLLHQAWRLYVDSARNAEVNKELTGRFYVEALVGLADVFSRLGEQCFVACKMSNLQLQHCDSYRDKFCKVLIQQQSRITEIKKRNSSTIFKYYCRLWLEGAIVPIELPVPLHPRPQDSKVARSKIGQMTNFVDSPDSDGLEGRNSDVQEQASTDCDGSENNADVDQQDQLTDHDRNRDNPDVEEQVSTNYDGSESNADVRQADQLADDLTDHDRNRDNPAVKEEVFQNIAARIPGRWKPLARCLGVKEDKITEIELDNQPKVVEQAYQMLWFWWTSLASGSPSWSENLGKALCEEVVGRNDLAKEFCNYSPPNENLT